MIEPSLPTSPDDPPRGGAGRRRLVVLAGGAAAAIALAGGVAGAIAGVVSRSATPLPAGPSLFFPAGGTGGGGAAATSGGGGGGGVPQGARGFSGGASMDMAAPSVQHGGFPSYAMTDQVATYPSPMCSANGAPPVQVQGDGITATAMVQLPLSSGTPRSATTLNVGVQQNDADVKTAIADARSRIAAVRAAIRSAGIPDAQITDQGFGVWANGNPKPVNSNVNDNLTVTITDPTLVDRVINAAVDAGANSLNLWSSPGASAATPSDDQVRSAITKATSEAHTMAEAEAQGAGLSIGAVRAITSQTPSLCPWAPGGPELVVAVTVTYAIK